MESVRIERPHLCVSRQSGGAQEGGREALRGAAAEVGAPGDRQGGKQTDCTGHLQAQLPGPAHQCGVVSGPAEPTFDILTNSRKLVDPCQ